MRTPYPRPAPGVKRRGACCGGRPFSGTALICDHAPPMSPLRIALVLALALHGPLPANADQLSTDGDPSPAATFDLDSNFVTGVANVTDFRWLPDGRLVIITKPGTAFVRPAGGGSLVTAGTFTVDSGSEKGLLGVAVHPDFATNHLLIFYY